MTYHVLCRNFEKKAYEHGQKGRNKIHGGAEIVGGFFVDSCDLAEGRCFAEQQRLRKKVYAKSTVESSECTIAQNICKERNEAIEGFKDA